MSKETVLRGLRATLAVVLFGLALLVAGPPAAALTPPLPGAVAFPSSTTLHLPFPSGNDVYVLSGYSPSGGSSLHADTDACCKANDHYALDLQYADEVDGGKGLPIVAPLAGVVVKAGWATSGWANYGQRVILQHDLGDGHTYTTMYAHLNAIDPAITEGAMVVVGQTIGELGQSCQGALSCGSFSAPHLHWVIHQDSTVGGSGTGGSYGGHAVVPEPLDGAEDLVQGDVLTSQNSPCTDDCPTCEPIAANGGMIDETDLCFERGGTPSYFTVGANGYADSVLSTLTTDDAQPDNHGIWHLTFVEGGVYRVEAYVEPGFASSELASYQVANAGAPLLAPLDQSASQGWSLLGELQFDAGPEYLIRLDDNTGEAASLSRVLAFDAVRLTRLDAPPGEGGSGQGGAPSAGGGSTTGVGAGDGNDPDGPASTDGCDCSTSSKRAPLGLSGSISLLFLAALRRRRLRRSSSGRARDAGNSR